MDDAIIKAKNGLSRGMQVLKLASLKGAASSLVSPLLPLPAEKLRPAGPLFFIGVHESALSSMAGG